MPSARGHFRLCTVLALLFSGVLCLRAEPPLPPKPDRYFNDYAHIVAPDVAQRLDARLQQFERETSNQILVAIFQKLPEGTYLEDYTIKTFQSWGPGGKRLDNGLVLFVFTEDRKMRMEVGYGLEGAVPDSIAASIIRNVIRPQFKAGNYGDGLEQGVEAIFKATRNEYKGDGSTLDDQSTSKGGGKAGLIVVGLVILFFIWSSMGDTTIQRGGRVVFWGLLDILRLMLISGLAGGRSSGGGGYSGGDSSGGGFRGGGGSGGGGGASGDW